MVDVHINHRFISAIPDDPDTDLIRPSNWNDSIIVTQGNEGDIIVRRGASSSGASWEPIIPTDLSDYVKGPGTSVDSQLSLFNGTTGKLIKADTHTGFIKAATGVVSAVPSIVEADLALTDITTANSSITSHGLLPKLDNDSTHYLNGQGAWATTTPLVTEDQLSFSDITTANSSTSKHGLLPKLDNDPNHFLNSQGVWATPAIVEGQLFFSDITVANTSTTQHGLTPKLDNDVTHFLNGQGTWTVPAGTNAKPSGYFYSKLEHNYVSTVSISGTDPDTDIEILSKSITTVTGQPVWLNITFNFDMNTVAIGPVTLKVFEGSIGGTLLLSYQPAASFIGFTLPVVFTAGATGATTYYFTGTTPSASETFIVSNITLVALQLL